VDHCAGPLLGPSSFFIGRPHREESDSPIILDLELSRVSLAPRYSDAFSDSGVPCRYVPTVPSFHVLVSYSTFQHWN
jgi:hypothetical protein